MLVNMLCSRCRCHPPNDASLLANQDNARPSQVGRLIEGQDFDAPADVHLRGKDVEEPG